MARTYKVTFRCEHSNGTLAQPGLHYQTDVAFGGDEPNAQDVADAIWNHLGAPFKNTVNNDTLIHELVVAEEVVPPAIGVAAAVTVAANGVIAFGDLNIPLEYVPLILWHTNTRSRSARGHTFMISPQNSTDTTIDGNWVTAYLGSLQGFANAATTPVSIAGPLATEANPVVYSRTRHRAGLTPYTFRVTGATAKAHPTWLRSRATSP